MIIFVFIKFIIPFFWVGHVPHISLKPHTNLSHSSSSPPSSLLFGKSKLLNNVLIQWCWICVVGCITITIMIHNPHRQPEIWNKHDTQWCHDTKEFLSEYYPAFSAYRLYIFNASSRESNSSPSLGLNSILTSGFTSASDSIFTILAI